MILDCVLNGGGVTLRQIEMSDCTQNYVDWLNDPMVNQYLETRWTVQNLDTVKKFVATQRDSDNSILLAITMSDDGRHIGNIKLGPINSYHNYGEISYFIGDKSMWQKGLATKAINLICGYGIERMNLHRIRAGAYAEAKGSWRALEKNRFKREAIFRNQVISAAGKYMDVYGYGLLDSEYKKL